MSNLAKDVAERVARTFAQAFLATYGLSLTDVLNLDLAAQAAAAGGSAVLALAMGLLGGKLGGSNEDASLR
jgi:hypothetical protein